MSRNIVDLTLSSDSDEEPAIKRRRFQSPGGGGASGSSQYDDGDVVVVDPVRPRVRQSFGSTDLGDEDLVITGAVGTVVTRDLPHPRPDCAEHRFTASTSTSNAAICSQCYCFVCDVKASACRYWGTGARERDHANARPLGYWRRLREAARGGNTNWVHSEYHGSGPLGSGIPPQPTMHQSRLPFPLAGRQSTGSAPATATAIGGQQGVAAAGGTTAPDCLQERPAAVGVCPAAVPGRAAASLPPSAPSAATAAAAPQQALEPQQAFQPAPAPATASVAAAQQSEGVGVVPRESSAVCKLRPLPDPRNEKQAFELGVLRFGVKAVRGLTIAALAARLQRFGFYYGVGTKADDYGNKLALDNLFDSRYGMHSGKYKSKAVHLKMLPLPPPPEEATPVPADRVRKVLVIDCLGRARATIMGVPVHVKAKRADLLVALAPMLRPLFSASCELLHLVHFASFEGNTIKVVEADATLDDSFFSTMNSSVDGPQLVVFRTSHHPAPTWPVPQGASHLRTPPSTGASPAWTEMPAYAHSSSPGAQSSAGSTPAWVVAQIRQYKPPPDAGMPPEDRYGLTSTRLAVPLLVPLRKDHARGGRDAEREFNTALQRGLEAYRTSAPLSAAHAAPAIVLRGNRSYMTDRPALTTSGRWGVAGDSVGTWAPGSSLHQLTAVMAHDLPATSYRLQDMRTPLVDPSASPDALRQSEANIAEAKRREESQRKRKELPFSCITELVTASRRPHPEDRSALAQLGNHGWCKCAVDATLVPSRQPGADPRVGELIIKVYCWSAGGLGRTSLFLPWDEWPSVGKRDDVRFPLPRTMELLATGATDSSDQDHLAAANGGSGPSTSRGPAAATGRAAGLAPELQSRIQAERRRARSMVASAKALCATNTTERYRSINSLVEFMQSEERPAVPQPPGLTVTMRPYQLQSLAFMLGLERYVDTPPGGGTDGPSTSAASGAASVSIDPADAPDGGCPGGYRRLFWVPVTNTQGQRFWYSPVFERLTMAVPAQPIGGFLAEEMGLGKTVVSVALTLANPAPPSVIPGAQLPCGRLASRATLVVCAVSLVGQWQAEAVNKTGGSCRIHPYHGQSRIRDPKRLATEFDIVVTTYQTLQSDHAGGNKDPCQQIKWHRVIFDEGHTLRSASAKLYKTAVELAADRKWLCTGTPINNAVEDLLGQFGAIHLTPLGKKTYFDSYIKSPFLNGFYRSGLSSTPLLYVLRHIMIRHTKAQNLGGEGVLQLPEKTEMDVPVYLSAKEQELYRKVHKEAQRGWQKLKAVGVAYVNSHLFTATSMLMPLRRICSGGLMRPQDLVVPDPERLSAVAGASGSGGAVARSDVLDDSAEVPVPEDISECPICVDTLEQPVVTRCNHWFCRECLTGWLNNSAHHNCPTCRQPVAVANLRRGVVGQPPAAAQSDVEKEDAEDGDPCEGIPCESKLQLLLAELRAMRAADSEAKALVFTQFGQTLEWLKPRLISEGFGHRTITGDMTQKKRTEAIESFQRDPSTCVFLLSVRSGAVGINLTAANYVFLLEPCMNPAMEEQAVGRSWRMGQQRPVVVKRFYVQGSVEERIMEVVKMRRAAGGSGDSTSGGAGPSSASAVPATGRAGGRNAGALTAGAMRQDKTDLRINELEMMFRDPEFTQSPAEGMAAGPR